jgi:hypothetical protein
VLQYASSLCDAWGGFVSKKMPFSMHVDGWDYQFGLMIFKINWAFLKDLLHVIKCFRCSRKSVSFDQCAGFSTSS